MEDSGIIDLYVNKKMTIKEISRIDRHAYSYIYHILKKNNIARRCRGRSGPRYVDRDMEMVEMHNHGIPEVQIGLKYGITKQAVDLRLKIAGVRGRAVPRCKCGCGLPSRRNLNQKNRHYYKILPEHRIYKNTYSIELKYTEDQIRKLYRLYTNLEDIASIIGVHSHTLARYLRRHNIVGMYPCKISKMGYTPGDIEMLLSHQQSICNLAVCLGVTSSSVYTYIRKHNLHWKE